MKFRKLGSSGMDVSILSLGSWLTFEHVDEKTRNEVVSIAIESGINFLDDARYNDATGKAPLKSGYSEVIFGEILRHGGWEREQLILANKFWFEFFPQESLEEELNGSLSRIKIDYIDLMYCLPPPDSLPIPDLVIQVNDLIKKGKIRAWGIVNWSVETIEAACQFAIENGLIPPCVGQLEYSLVNRNIVESEQMHKVCKTYDFQIVSSYSLAGGLLTGKYHNMDSSKDFRLTESQIKEYQDDGTYDKAEKLCKKAEKLGVSPAQLAIAYCLKNEQVSSVLFGAKSVPQMKDNLASLDLLERFDDALLEQVRLLA